MRSYGYKETGGVTGGNKDPCERKNKQKQSGGSLGEGKKMRSMEVSDETAHKGGLAKNTHGGKGGLR